MVALTTSRRYIPEATVCDQERLVPFAVMAVLVAPAAIDAPRRAWP